jgi:hypothetical protein
MQKQQVLHFNEEVADQALHSNAEAEGATLYCRSSGRYTVIQMQQALHCNAEEAGPTL